jgi:hypothetical protein
MNIYSLPRSSMAFPKVRVLIPLLLAAVFVPGILAAQWWYPLTQQGSDASFEEVVSLGVGTLPLRSQHAIASWNAQPIVVFTDGKDVIVAERDGTRHRVTTLRQVIGGPTIAASGDRVVVAWVTGTAIVSSSSADLVTWSTPITVGTREQDGGPIPSADWTGSDFVVVWVDAPKTNVATGGMDGVGALRVARGNGVNGWNVSTVNSTTAIVAVSESTLVWRDDRGVDSASAMFDSVRIADLDGSHEVVVCSGYDPAISVDGDAIAIGYHLGAEAHLRTTLDQEVWNDVVVDSTGKFVSPFVVDGVFGATWVDYVDAAAAEDARNDMGHRVTTIWDGVEYFMNDGAVQTVQGQADTVGGIPFVVYSVNGVVYLSS